MIHTYVLHLLNGSSVNGSAVFYNGDCEEMCAKADIPIFDVRCCGAEPNLRPVRLRPIQTDPPASNQYKAYWACLSRHFLAFGIEDRWQREQVVIPGGFWAQPASYATALANGRTPIGDDIGRYSPSGAWVYKTADGLLQKADFKARFKTTLALHMGGGLKGSGAALAVKVRNELFPWCPLRGSSWLVSDAFGSGEKPLTDWKFRVDRLS